MIYRRLFSMLLARIEPERTHTIASAALRLACATGPGRAVLKRLVGPTDPCLRTVALGRSFSSPFGVAAGVDKDATWFRQLAALGFGFVEVGTLTAVAQPGNPPPRIVRVRSERALLNRMGFPNRGATAAAARLRGRTGDTVVGVNVGKSGTVELAQAGSDYRATVRALAPHVDYLVINVSSPNTPGLRELQTVERLRPLLADVRAELAAGGHPVPLLVKISPDLADAELAAVCQLTRELALDGIVATNTTIDRSVLRKGARQPIPFDGGGVSGAPLRDRALQVLRQVRAAVGPEPVLIAVGGVIEAEDVWQRILAGATLVQTYTGLVYGGPAWPRRINRELAARCRALGYGSIQELVGAIAPPEASS